MRMHVLWRKPEPTDYNQPTNYDEIDDAMIWLPLLRMYPHAGVETRRHVLQQALGCSLRYLRACRCEHVHAHGCPRTGPPPADEHMLKWTVYSLSPLAVI